MSKNKFEKNHKLKTQNSTTFDMQNWNWKQSRLGPGRQFVKNLLEGTQKKILKIGKEGKF